MPAGTGSQKKIRDLNRSIQKAGDDAEKIALLRGKIQEIENDKTGRLEKDKRSKHENKYHLVKFVERKKLTRSIQRTLRELESSENSDQRNQLQTLLDSLKDDLTYVMYYPVDMKYVALFAGQAKHNKDGNNDQQDDSRYQMDDREKSLSNRARLFARAARERDLSSTGRDLVAHAIEVHLNGGSGSKKRKRNENIIGTGEKGGLSEDLLSAFKRKADQSHNDDDDDDEEEEEEIKLHRQPKSSRTLPSSSVSLKHENGNKERVASQARESSSPLSSAYKAKKAKTDRPSISNPVITPSAPEADAFFVEEVAEAVGATNEPTLPSRDPRPVKRDYHRVKAVVDHKKHRTHKNLKFKNQNQVRQFSS